MAKLRFVRVEQLATVIQWRNSHMTESSSQFSDLANLQVVVDSLDSSSYLTLYKRYEDDFSVLRKNMASN